ncbi:MAG: hypothetical protein PHU25_20930 [Deltaproteobacteria bacterium]|nr:hypothetical protein [Deltaproteobacteria bacterium]
MRTQTKIIQDVLREHAHLALPAAAACVVLASARALIAPVLNLSGDNAHHLVVEYVLARSLAAGDNPFGPLGMDFGQPFLRFYQALFSLSVEALHFLAGLDLRTANNALAALAFALSPFAYLHFLRKLGLSRWAASLGAFLSMLSVAAFGNSFEAYEKAGILTQALGGLFLPWFLGSFIGMLRGEDRPAKTAILFALACLSHAAMAVFATLSCGLYLASTRVGLAAWKRLVPFAALGVLITAFWLVPFVAHAAAMRPIPDSVMRGEGVAWFKSASRAELAELALTGRLLDDPRVVHADQTDPRDRLMDALSLFETVKTRPPVVTILVGLGVLAALFSFRRAPCRFLLAGLAFSLMLFSGPDDFRFLRFVPFSKDIQFFRCTYLVELFAFGLAGLGAERTIVALASFSSLAPGKARGLARLAVAAIVGLGIAWCVREMWVLGHVHQEIGRLGRMARMADAAQGALPDRGYPFRAAVVTSDQAGVRQAYLAERGFAPLCTHWKAVGPNAVYGLCKARGEVGTDPELLAVLGARFVVGDGRKLARYAQAFERRNPGAADAVLDTGEERFLVPLPAAPVPVVCSAAQWARLAEAWASRFGPTALRAGTPLFMRVLPGGLSSSGLMDAARTVLYLDPSEIERDRASLAALADRGGTIISAAPLPGLRARVPGSGQRLLDLLPAPRQDATDRASSLSEIRFVRPKKLTAQRYAFDIEFLGPLLALLPTEAAPGWTTSLDGRPLPTFPSGPDMLGVRLPAGAHRVVFSWRMPPADRAAAWASVLGLAMALASLLIRKHHERP